MSQIIHISNCIPINEDIVKDNETTFNNFLWNGKTNKVKSTVMTQEFKHGGCKMIDIKSVLVAQKLKWVKLYLNNHFCMWRNLFESMIKVANLNIFLRSNFVFSSDYVDSVFLQRGVVSPV